MIKTRFEGVRYGAEPFEPFEREMPFPVRVGDSVEIEETGRNLVVLVVCWVVSEDPTNEFLELIVKLK
jgi:hypothetical protein